MHLSEVPAPFYFARSFKAPVFTGMKKEEAREGEEEGRGGEEEERRWQRKMKKKNSTEYISLYLKKKKLVTLGLFSHYAYGKNIHCHDLRCI